MLDEAPHEPGYRFDLVAGLTWLAVCALSAAVQAFVAWELYQHFWK